MAHLYLVISYSGTGPAWLIRKFTKRPYSHASIALDRSLGEIYSFGRKRLYNPLNAGFVTEKIGEGIYRRFPDTTCVVLELSVTEESYRKVCGVIAEMLAEREKYRYNFVGVARAARGKTRPRPYQYFCSEFVRMVLARSGVDLSTVPAACHPMDFLDLPCGKVIYTGKLNAYPGTQKV